MKNGALTFEEARALIGAFEYLDRCTLDFMNIREQRCTDTDRYRIILREIQEQTVIALDALEEK